MRVMQPISHLTRFFVVIVVPLLVTVKNFLCEKCPVERAYMSCADFTIVPLFT